MIPEYCRIYSVDGVDEEEGFMSTYFKGAIKHGGEPYYCPIGWLRWAVDIGLTGEEFEDKYDDWPVAYHGTHPKFSLKILKKGFHHSEKYKCHLPRSDRKARAVYFSPSIEYAAHERYARVYQVKNLYAQTVLQVRIKPSLITIKGPGTLDGAFSNNPTVDPNFSSTELEWVIRWDKKTNIKAEDGIIVYGFMMRFTEQHPKTLPKNAWWSASEKNTGESQLSFLQSKTI